MSPKFQFEITEQCQGMYSQKRWCLDSCPSTTQVQMELRSDGCHVLNIWLPVQVVYYVQIKVLIST